jgi:hypothetical protein
VLDALVTAWASAARGCPATGAVADSPLRSWFNQHRRKQEQWRRDVNAYHMEAVRQREEISDEELIAQEPGIPVPPRCRLDAARPSSPDQIRGHPAAHEEAQ